MHNYDCKLSVALWTLIQHIYIYISVIKTVKYKGCRRGILKNYFPTSKIKGTPSAKDSQVNEKRVVQRDLTPIADHLWSVVQVVGMLNGGENRHLVCFSNAVSQTTPFPSQAMLIQDGPQPIPKHFREFACSRQAIRPNPGATLLTHRLPFLIARKIHQSRMPIQV